MKSYYYYSIAIAALFPSCAIEPPEAKKMTFVNAMENLSDGMKALRDGAPHKGERSLGLVPTEMTATFELTSTTTGSLGVNLATAPVGPFSSIGANTSNSQSIGRKNTVTVTFKNVFVDSDGKPRSPGESGVANGGIVIPMIVGPQKQ